MTDPRYCYILASQIDRLLDEQKIIDAVMDQLVVPGKPSELRRKTKLEKLALIELQIEHYRLSPSSMWYGVSPSEVLAATIYRASNLSDTLVFKEFHHVKRESDLEGPVSEWILRQKLGAYAEINVGKNRIDFLGYADGISPASSIGVELKNDLKEFDRGLDQMTTYQEHLGAVYLACTPLLAAEYLDREAEANDRWDAQALERKLRRFGLGLLIVEGEKVSALVAPVEKSPNIDRFQRIIEAVRLRMEDAA